MALPSRSQDYGPLVRVTPLALRSFFEKRCSQILSGCYPALAGEASKVLAQHLSQPLKTKYQIMYLNRVTLIGFTGQEPKTLATRTGKERSATYR
jgi:hypothetical protein